MASYKVFLVLSALCVSVNAGLFEPFKGFRRPRSTLKPWLGDRFVFDQFPAYGLFPRTHEDSIASFSRAEFVAAKKPPAEDKHSKKEIVPVPVPVPVPFYTITEKNSERYKDVVLKSKVPYCEEMKTKPRYEASKSPMVCFKCKNPENGASYEQCSYASEPISESSARFRPTFRNRRSNKDENFEGESRYRSRDNPYRFSEKFFAEMSQSQDVPVEYKNGDEKCEKVVKDSMVCMVCNDAKTNGKYEQCSYVHQPSQQAYAYTKSSSFQDNERPKEEPESRKDQRDYSDPDRANGEPDKKGSNAEESVDKHCKTVEKDSKTCTVCKDPKGGYNEKCSYAYQPNDKVYQFTKSKSFGYPEFEEYRPNYGGKYTASSGGSAQDYQRDSFPQRFYEKYRPSDAYRPSESKSYSYRNEEPNYESKSLESQDNCEKVQKDSMVCTVCKDPKTGGNREQCSYSHQPNDKTYSYGKSRTFGEPEGKSSEVPYSEDTGYGFASKPYDGRPTESRSTTDELKEQSEETTTRTVPDKTEMNFFDAYKKKAEIEKVLQDFQKEDRSKCKRVMRDKMTCYQCVDEKGFQKEECAYITNEPEVKGYEVDGPNKARSTEEAKPERRIDDFPLEPAASASEKMQTKREKPVREQPDERTRVDSKEVDAYEFASETRPVFDKVLGLTLPAYMLTTSEHEAEFDEVVASTRF